MDQYLSFTVSAYVEPLCRSADSNGTSWYELLLATRLCRAATSSSIVSPVPDRCADYVVGSSVYKESGPPVPESLTLLPSHTYTTMAANQPFVLHWGIISTGRIAQDFTKASNNAY